MTSAVEFEPLEQHSWTPSAPTLIRVALAGCIDVQVVVRYGEACT
jgi:hypothetical protein